MTTVKIERTSNAINVTKGDSIVAITRDGLQGPAGPPGPPGPAGGETYVHTQSASATTWTISHNLSRYPSITVVDSAGTVVIGAAHYVDTNTVELSFSSPFQGKAFLN